ncbi:MAG TPA: LacI family DNA-binding transcriptional regulator [Polyangiaceae bacterium]|nr:LacI family DNA-binding transcriptional regulator [Polyangiaceae bacterium]
MGSKPTIRDVAKKAGVSIATVSYVLNDNSDEVISAPAKQRVWSAVRALNYHRAAAAVSLATKRTRNIGVILYPGHSDVTNPFYSFVIQGVIREAMDRDYNLLFSYIESRYRDRRDLPKIIREANVAGVLFVGHINVPMLCDIRDSGIAVVAVDHHPHVKKVASIQIDNVGGGELAARHLLDLGHEHVAFVGRVKGIASIVRRCDGFVRGVERLGGRRATHVEVVACDLLNFHEGHRRSRELLEKNRAITGLFCANDEVAAGALRAAHELGLSVPADVSVVGFDDIIMSNYTDPPLTTVSVGKEQMGRRATARLLELIERRRSDTKEEVIAVDLVVRSSTAAARVRAKRPGGRAVAG